MGHAEWNEAQGGKEFCVVILFCFWFLRLWNDALLGHVSERIFT